MGLDVSLHEESIHDASVNNGLSPAERRKSMKLNTNALYNLRLEMNKDEEEEEEEV